VEVRKFLEPAGQAEGGQYLNLVGLYHVTCMSAMIMGHTHLQQRRKKPTNKGHGPKGS